MKTGGTKEMRTVEDYEAIRRAYFLEGKSIREISRELHHARRVVRKAIANAEPERYKMVQPRVAPVIAPYKPKIEELLKESLELPRKQRYTAHKIFELVEKQGYSGCEGGVHNYVCQWKKAHKGRPAYLPLEFDPGQDAQVDWGEVQVEIGGVRMTVQVFVMRLNYSKARFVMAFPFQKQEAFFEGHIQGYHFFGGIPRRITYDNLKTAVFRVLEGHDRQEQTAFKTFRSYYLFESRYCTPAQGHEKGGVENDVGYAQRNFFSPIPQVASFAALNEQLRQACLDNLQRKVRGQSEPVAELWRSERGALLPLPAKDYQACTLHVVKVNPYSQVVFETNRYSVPTVYVGKQLVLHAFPFRVELLSLEKVVTVHARCFEREQDILDPQHYLSLLEQRPGAFEHAIPLRRWSKHWPEDYDRLLEELRQRQPDGRGIREFVCVLKLHHDYPAEQVEKAVHQAVAMGAAHLDGVRLCLRQMQVVPELFPLELSRPELTTVGSQPIHLEQYNQLLEAR
jgi:transposase